MPHASKAALAVAAQNSSRTSNRRSFTWSILERKQQPTPRDYSTSIMLLVEDGKLAIDDPITNHFAWIPKEWGKVTVRNLLTHTSGIPEEEWKGGIAEFDRFEYNQQDVESSTKSVVAMVMTRPGIGVARIHLESIQ